MGYTDSSAEREIYTCKCTQKRGNLKSITQLSTLRNWKKNLNLKLKERNYKIRGN